MQAQMLEKRLNDTLVKFNIEIQGNRSLRDLIGEKRRDCIFDEIYSELEREMQRLSQQMRANLRQKILRDGNHEESIAGEQSCIRVGSERAQYERAAQR